MSTLRPQKTFADYIGIAIGPILIMTLLGSLTFFLLEIGYVGDYAARLRWTLFWFVLASVLVSRISIEQGSGVAGVYGFGLALVTGMMIHRFVGFVIIVWLLLAFIWWCASKLTWDCTLIDDNEDASGAGLLQVAGLDESVNQKERVEETDESSEEAARGPAQKPKKPQPANSWWRRLFQNRSEYEGQPHSPGLWVVYFSLVALPMFGVGQLLIPANGAASRRYGFALLVIYVASALGLLLTTSFLGLRRYLRQRRLQMPAAMAAGWVTLGATLAMGILFACILLPRPDAKYSLTALVTKITSPEQKASDRSVQSDEAAEGSNRQLGRAGENDGDQAKQAMSGTDGTTSGKGAQEGSLNPNGSPDSKPKFSLADLLKWLIYGILVGLVLYAFYRHRVQLMAMFSQMIQEFLNFWRRLFGLRPREINPAENASGATALPMPPRPFSAFRNPFSGSAANRLTLAELISYSFEALQAWARDRGCERRLEQTPFEFAAIVSEIAPALSDDVIETTRAYGRLAYAGQLPPPETTEVLQRLWQQMTATGK